MENLPANWKENASIKMAPGGGLLPENFEGLYRMSQIFAASGFMPKGVNRTESVFVAIQMGLEVGLSPMAAVQNIAVINGRPSIWGDSALGLVQASGLLEYFFEEFSGTFPHDDFTAVCTIQRKGDDKQTIRTFSIADAKLANIWSKEGPWQTYPKRMLQMRARSWAMRDRFSDVLKGLRVAEEAMDYDAELIPNAAGTYEAKAEGSRAIDLSNRDTSLYKGKPAPEAPAAETEVADPPASQTKPLDWDPLKEAPMGRYTPEKAAAVKAAAEELGIKFAKSWPPGRIHALLIEKMNQPATPQAGADDAPPPHAEAPAPSQDAREDGGQPSLHDRFFIMVDENLAEGEKALVNDYLTHCVNETNGTPREFYENALKNTAEFLEFYRGWLEHQTVSQGPEWKKLVGQAENCRRYNADRWNAIIKTSLRAGFLPGTDIDGWSLGQLKAVVDEFSAVDNDHQRETADDGGQPEDQF